jgi:hypothetical protein
MYLIKKIRLDNLNLYNQNINFQFSIIDIKFINF